MVTEVVAGGSGEGGGGGRKRRNRGGRKKKKAEGMNNSGGGDKTVAGGGGGGDPPGGGGGKPGGDPPGGGSPGPGGGGGGPPGGGGSPGGGGGGVPNDAVRTYFKVFASFRCSNERCKKGWQSAHGWEREDDEGGINCEICGQPAELVNAVDEMLQLDTYICGCENLWQSIHVAENAAVPQECDICHLMVLPDGLPQERFGRHYWLQCLNDQCPEQDNVEWEDFSLTGQKTQRCTKCFSRGDIIKVSKLKQMPPWLWKRRREEQLRRRRGGDEEPDMEERPSNHVTEFCDMCQDIRRQGKGKNCRQWRMIKTKLMEQADGSGPEEVILELKHLSDNPFHYDVRGSGNAYNQPGNQPGV